ncbi:Fic family protein [Candidatus Berkiella cookevillensis]|uniref:Protein adenylyltransferase n=1 Tax=Candidatus Berkiella cookevillensis TaxID=437022 RepID=A0A0Q9YBU8_9GAMM|nr:Fic family protein [Candidatus Berkiella cookevillensis]MCS5709201.1 Fic family protein [Candidatus Berkiella cookevillensis]
MTYQIPNLPLDIDIESKVVLKKAGEARSALAELKGVTGIIPNQNILINTLSLQEAKDSSAIENIITTQDELYESDALAHQFTTTAAKEVYSYATALKRGFEKVKKNSLLTNNHIIEIQSTLIENGAGFRKLPGTSLKNEQTGQIIYEPPQHPEEIQGLMDNLEQFINNPELCEWDALVKMAVIHHQFESIHPFYDGNGRTGRIINILYLVQQDLLESPVLYLSRYINKNKTEYYRLLQLVRDNNAWEEWVLYILEGVRKTSLQTIHLIHAMKELMQNYKHKIREELPKIYSQDLLNIIFGHPYTKIAFVEKELNVTRLPATRYLDELSRIGLMQKTKLGRESYYINNELMNLISNVQDL